MEVIYRIHTILLIATDICATLQGLFSLDSFFFVFPFSSYLNCNSFSIKAIIFLRLLWSLTKIKGFLRNEEKGNNKKRREVWVQCNGKQKQGKRESTWTDKKRMQLETEEEGPSRDLLTLNSFLTVLHSLHHSLITQRYIDRIKQGNGLWGEVEELSSLSLTIQIWCITNGRRTQQQLSWQTGYTDSTSSLCLYCPNSCLWKKEDRHGHPSFLS